MTNAEIVSKLWNLCNVLRDDGITYHQYVTELTYILFLKMAKETVETQHIIVLTNFGGKFMLVKVALRKSHSILS